MNDEMNEPVSRAEALAALADVDTVIAQTRTAIAHGAAGPILILWGCIWAAADATIQFYPPAMQWIWFALDIFGVAATFWLVGRRRVQVKQSGRWRYMAFWLVLFFYAFLWMFLLLGKDLGKTDGTWVEVEPTYRKMASYWHTVPMFAYVIIGMWLGRFLIWIGVVVTMLVIAGLWVAPHYYYLWLAVTCGGALALSGVFINKFWK